MQSVRAWCRTAGYDYRFIGDELFGLLPAPVRQKTRDSKIVATDLARLLWLRRMLDAGLPQVVWLDADTLILDPEQLRIPKLPYAVGREVWVEADPKAKRWRARVKVHNAFLLFGYGNAFLDFYIDTASRLLLAHQGPHIVPQFIGPKLLTALHNVVGLPVIEEAAILSPAVALDLLGGGGEALECFRRRSAAHPQLVNLCGSSVRNGDLSETQMERVIASLKQGGFPV